LISVIIPTLNEASLVESAILCAFSQKAVSEVIVVDGGSLDGTPKRARSASSVIASPPGRSIQMNVGARASRGDILVFLHADSKLPPTYTEEVLAATEDSDVVGGCAPVRFDHRGFLLNMYSRLSRLKPRIFHYGDGAVFVRRSVFDRLGGYRDMPLMEDLVMIRALNEAGRFALLKSPVTTSSRRFLAGGVAYTQIKNTVLVGLFLLGADPRHLKLFYPDKVR